MFFLKYIKKTRMILLVKIKASLSLLNAAFNPNINLSKKFKIFLSIIERIKKFLSAFNKYFFLKDFDAFFEKGLEVLTCNCFDKMHRTS